MIMRMFLLGMVLVGCGVCSVQADVRETKHNLTGKVFEKTQGDDERDRKKMRQEVCIFCHTPGILELEDGEGGESDGDDVVSRPVPEQRVAKWQRSVDPAFSFDLFDDIGRSGGEGVDPVGSVSVACLSCHDALQAFGVAPGGVGDHAFGVPYLGAEPMKGVMSKQFREQLRAFDRAGFYESRFIDPEGFRPPRTGVINKRRVWWAAVTDSGRRTKSDLPLYPRRLGDGSDYKVVPFVECTSCHDPHSTREVFLRTANDRSALCATCHVK